MENIKVRLLDGGETKGIAEVEQELLEKHEQKLNEEQITPETEKVVETPDAPETPQAEDLTEEKVLSFIEKKYGKQINSFEELMSEREKKEVLPEDVAAYMKYKQETGRGLDDFIQLQKDYDAMDPESLLKKYLSATQVDLDEEDIDVLMDAYRYDEDEDDESTIKRVKLETKKAVAEAKRYFNEQKEKYKVPLESSAPLFSPEEKEEYESYKQYTKQAKTIEEENERKKNWFLQKTEELFSGDFKGFDFDVADKKITFNPGDAAELKKIQSNPANFIAKFLDEQGLIKDTVGYHKALAVALNPEKFAKFFYEQGKSDATEGTLRNIKNINMSDRKVPEIAKSTEGIQVKAVNPDSGRSLKIRSIKKV